MALMRTGRKMMMGDPPSLPTRRQDVTKAMSDLQQVKISGPKDDPFVGTFARKGDIAETSKRNKMAQESYSKASSEYKQKSEAKSSYDKQKAAYDEFLKSKPTRKAKGTLEDMTEEQEMSVYGKKELSGSELESFYNAPSNKSFKQSRLPNERILVHDYEEQKKTGFKGPMNVTRMYKDPGADPGSPGKAPEQPKLVQPKTTTVGRIKKDEVESWASPTRTRGGGSKLMTQKIPVKKSTSERQKGYTYGKERKMAAAYYGAIGDVLGEEGRYATSGALGDFQKTRKEDIKSLKSEKRASSDASEKRSIKKDIKSSRKDIREAKLAQKYVESLPNKYQSSAGVAKDDIRRNVENEKLPEGKNKPKRVVRTFTPESMKGSTEQSRQSMLTETKKVRNLGPTKRTMPKNR
jgi:hypothetical protein